MPAPTQRGRRSAGRPSLSAVHFGGGARTPAWRGVPAQHGPSTMALAVLGAARLFRERMVDAGVV